MYAFCIRIATGSITNVYVLILPVPRLLKLQVTRRKVGLLLVLASGLGACAVGLARISNPPPQYRYTPGPGVQCRVPYSASTGLSRCCHSTFFTQVPSLGWSIYDAAASLLHIPRASASKRTSASKTKESERSSTTESRSKNARLRNLERLKGATAGL
ncbi:hypothetical protein BDW72DRAFT_204270 [Aspergillus terricola var. indicus]